MANKQRRAELRDYFKPNAMPTAGNFADLIESALNLKDDGLTKAAGEPLSVEASSAGNRAAIKLYESFGATKEAWTLSLSTAEPPAGTAGLTISDGDGSVRLSINRATGVLTAHGALSAAGGLTVPGGQTLAVAGTLTATGTTSTGALTANGLITASAGLRVPANQTLTVNGTLTATGTTSTVALTASGMITANAGLTVPANQTLTVNGTLTATGTVNTGALTANGLITANSGLTVPVNQPLSVLGAASIGGDITMKRSMLRLGTTDGSQAASGEVVGAIGFWGYGRSHGQLSYRAGQGFELVDRSAEAPSLDYMEGAKPYADLKLHSLAVSGSLTVASDVHLHNGLVTVIRRSHKHATADNQPISKDYVVIHVKGLFLGNHVRVHSIVAGTKNFEIDHPLDPRRKTLVHSSLEGPEVGVYYRGEGQLEGGRADIVLPPYFEALTRKEDRTIILTPRCEGDEPVSALAATAIAGGRCAVRAIDDRNHSQRFYWEVKAVRADLPPLTVERRKRGGRAAAERIESLDLTGELS